MDHSVRLGLELPALPSGATAAEVAGWRAMAAAAEVAGFGALWVVGDGCDACTLAGGLVPLTRTVTLGVVADLPGGRHPSVLARDLTGLDVLSGGRAAVLLVVPAPPAEALDQPAGVLDEAVAICRALFSGDAAHLAGRHYSVDGAVNRPGPVRPGGPPVLAQDGNGDGAGGDGPGIRGGSAGGSGPAVDGWVITGTLDDLAAVRGAGDRPLLWRGPVPDAAAADGLLRAGVDGVVARVGSVDEVRPLADLLLGRWPD